jgi:hypothetical protein
MARGRYFWSEKLRISNVTNGYIHSQDYSHLAIEDRRM